jgi:peroxiredoxin
LRRTKDRFDALGARVVLVGLGTVEETARFKSRFDIPFDMIADPEKALFRAFGLKQASTGKLLSVGMAVKGVSAMLRGHGLGMPQGDVRQLPGVFIIDTDGRIRYRYFAEGPADHPAPEDLIDVLQSL